MSLEEPLLVLVLVCSSACGGGHAAIEAVDIGAVQANAQVEVGLGSNILAAEAVGRGVTIAVTQVDRGSLLAGLQSSSVRLVTGVVVGHHGRRSGRIRRLGRACYAKDLASSAAFDALVQVVVHQFQVVQHPEVLMRDVFEVLDLTDPLGKGLEGGAVVLDLMRLYIGSCQKEEHLTKTQYIRGS